jgi:hypothetical protein
MQLVYGEITLGGVRGITFPRFGDISATWLVHWLSRSKFDFAAAVRLAAPVYKRLTLHNVLDRTLTTGNDGTKFGNRPLGRAPTIVS